jgi:hypothetical protein
MNKGCLIFAHDGDIDYGSQAVLAAELAQRHLKVPVSLAADAKTIKNINKNFKQLPFDRVIKIARPTVTNKRFLVDHDVEDANLAIMRLKAMMDSADVKQIDTLEKFISPKPAKETVDFINDSRVLAYDITPYDRTLLIDSDFLIFSDQLNKYWDLPYDLMISPGMLELQQNTIGPCDYELNNYSIWQLWATTVMFTKSEETRIFFNLLQHIKDEYEYYSHLYDFDQRQYRNDFTFSIACHIMGHHGAAPWHGELPVPLMFTDADSIAKIKPSGEIIFVLNDLARQNDYLLAKTQGQDIHVMNKRDILRHLDQLRELARG